MEPNGILVVNKPSGITSHDVVNLIRRLYNTRRVGHAGTLDPIASGVLVVLIGRSAKLSEYLLSQDKRYTAGLRLGISTDTDDITGRIISESEDIPPFARIEEAVKAELGDIMQTPPAFSAIKKNGKKMLELARQGAAVELEPRPVTIHSIDCRPGTAQCDIELDVHCSKGTYIRSICRDIGRELGCGGTMSSLVRTQSGAFSITSAHTLEQIEEASEKERLKLLLTPEEVFSDLPSVALPPFYARLAYSGCEIYLKKLKLDGLNEGQLVRMYDGADFFALGRVRAYPDGLAVKSEKLLKIKAVAEPGKDGPDKPGERN